MVTITLTETQARLLLLVADYFMEEYKDTFKNLLQDEGLALDEATTVLKSRLDGVTCVHTITL